MKIILNLMILSMIVSAATFVEAKRQRQKRNEIEASLSPFTVITEELSFSAEDSTDSVSSRGDNYAQADQRQLVAQARSEATVVYAKTLKTPEPGESTELMVSGVLFRSVALVKESATDLGINGIDDQTALSAIVRGCLPVSDKCVPLAILD